MKKIEAKTILKNEMIPYWLIAKKLGVSEMKVYRMLRDNEENLPVGDEEKIIKAIREICIERSEKKNAEND